MLKSLQKSLKQHPDNPFLKGHVAALISLEEANDRCSAATNSELDDYSTDDLLERLPSNLHLARNENAPEHDRWRMYNSATDEYITPGHSTARAAMIHLITRQEKERRDWNTPNAADQGAAVKTQSMNEGE
jgi:hypothetical protein